MNSSKYQGDGHYLIDARALTYVVIYEEGEDCSLHDELYGDCDPNDYYPAIDTVDSPFFECDDEKENYFQVGITFKHNQPQQLVYHGTGMDSLDSEPTHDSLDQFNDKVKTTLSQMEFSLISHPSWMSDPCRILEIVSNDTWAYNIPSLVIDLNIPPHLFKLCMDYCHVSYKEVERKEVERKEVERKDLNDWKEQVKDRDNVCIVCGSEKHLVCHHVYPFKLYPDLRDDVGNGVVLCKWCHNKYHSYYGKGENVNPSSLVEFVQRFGTGATKSHVTTVEHVEQVLSSGYSKNKNEQIDEVLLILNEVKLKSGDGLSLKELHDKMNEGDKRCSYNDLKIIMTGLLRQGLVYQPIGKDFVSTKEF